LSARRHGSVRPTDRIGIESFEDRRLVRPGTWAVAFLADWCPFCRAFVPPFLGLEGLGFGIAIADLTDVESPLWERFEIEVVPSVIVFRDGVPVFRANGRYGEGLGPEDLAAVRSAAAAP
jgi:thiol-disulfide isomerase/thioredoxin